MVREKVRSSKATGEVVLARDHYQIDCLIDFLTDDGLQSFPTSDDGAFSREMLLLALLITDEIEALRRLI